MQRIQSEKNMADSKITVLSKQIDSMNKELGRMQNQMLTKSDTQSKETAKCKQENSELSQRIQKSEIKVVALTHEVRKVESNYQRLQEKLKALSGDKIQYKNSYEITCKMDKPYKKAVQA